MVKDNQHIINIKSRDNQEMSVDVVKIALQRDLIDYEDEMKGNGDEFFDFYEDIQNSLGKGYTRPTIRKWITQKNGCLPNPIQHKVLCRYIGRRKSLDALIQYLR